MDIDFGDKPAIVEVYAEHAEDEECINYVFKTQQEKAKLKAMTVRKAVEFVIDHCRVDALTEVYKRNIEAYISGTSDYSIDVFGNLLVIKKDSETGEVQVDERDNNICDPQYWDEQQNRENQVFYVSELRLVQPPPPSGLERVLVRPEGCRLYRFR